MSFEIESAVIALIESELNRLGLPKTECTLLGYSKGGSAALLFGLKYGFHNIIASAPQMHIGSFAKENFNSSFRHMTDIGSQDEVDVLDGILPSVLNSITGFERNIYIISSEEDQFHNTEILPYIESFNRFSNFNMIMTDSPLVDEHKVLGAYNTPIVLSIVYALAEGCVPAFRTRTNGIGRLGPQTHSRAHVDMPPILVAELDRIRVESGRLFPEGVALERGIQQTSYNEKTVSLQLESESDVFNYPLGGSVDKSISSRFFEHSYIDYSYAGFKSLASKGVDISGLPHGTYSANLSVNIADRNYIVPLTTHSARQSSCYSDGKILVWESNLDGASVWVAPAINLEIHRPHFKLHRFETDGFLVYIDGAFAIPHIDGGSYDNTKYCLVLREQAGSLYTYPLAQGHRPELSKLFKGTSDQSKSHFTTPKYAGISLLGLPDGIFDCFVSYAHRGSVQSVRIDRRITVSESEIVVLTDTDEEWPT